MAVNIIVTVILAVIIAAIVRYLYKAKKSGAACIGCPHAKQCGNQCHCHQNEADRKES